jgi:hypothetical protein
VVDVSLRHSFNLLKLYKIDISGFFPEDCTPKSHKKMKTRVHGFTFWSKGVGVLFSKISFWFRGPHLLESLVRNPDQSEHSSFVPWKRDQI